MTAALDRKDFLRIVAAGGAAGLSLSLGFVPNAADAAVPAMPAAPAFVPVAWVEMGLDGLTTVVVNQTELGQGIATALPMCVAEELDVPMSSVRFRISPAEPKYYNAQWHGIQTGGSKSTPSMSPVMRNAGATARAMLVSAAAAKWNVDPATCSTSDATVIGPAGQRAKYVELLAAAAAVPVPASVKLKTPDKYKIIGTRQPRLDVKPKTNGTAVYGMDVKVPGMKYASIEKPVQIGGKVASFDASAALKYPGVRKVIQVPSGVAVIADNTWAAFQGRKLLKVTFAPGPNAGVSTDSIYTQARAMSKTPGVVLKSAGDVTTPLSGKVVTASYETQYLAHAPMEPMNTTADVRADGVTLWTPTQAQTDSQKVAAKIAGVPLESVKVVTTFVGGGFGRRGETDFVEDAVNVSKAAGMPIKLVWTREDDIRNDPYRGGTVQAMVGAMTPDGKVTTLKQTMVCSSIVARAIPFLFKDGKDPLAGNGMTNLGYTIPNQLVDWHNLNVAIPVGFWRAPYANSNTFAAESFIDELAHAAGQDPVAFRLAMLDAGSRQRGVLERVAKLAKWGSSLPAGHAQGVAMGQWDDAWIAMVAEISMPNNKLKIHKMIASVDVGQPIN
ncbi:MAG TPA: molybdopterin cofactor-binding domain-containing protein, partial [Candidatus Lustribacter sp.]|nr:molybdopterin cofactor-binding domain-containing protein [Candidatus Lustribacter sp.]